MEQFPAAARSVAAGAPEHQARRGEWFDDSTAAQVRKFHRLTFFGRPVPAAAFGKF
jgi:hypothetical protein